MVLESVGAQPGYRFTKLTIALHDRHHGASKCTFLTTTLYFETDEGDEFRKPGFSKERRLEPQITVGLLSDASGFPLSVGAFEGNMAETWTMLPMIRKFQDSYDVDGITIVADAGMFSASNKKAIIDAGLHYILGTKLPDMPQPISQWHKNNPGVSTPISRSGRSRTARAVVLRGATFSDLLSVFPGRS